MPDVTLNPSIVPSFTAPSQAQSTPTVTTTDTPTTSYTPLWMVNDSVGSNAFEMLGLRRPNAVGDLAAMLAEVSLTLEKSITESDKNKALSGFARMFAALGAYGLSGLRDLVVRTEGTYADLQTRVGAYNAAAAPKLNTLNSLNASIGLYDAQIASLNAQISSLQTQLASAKDSEKPAIQLQLTAAQASLSAATSSRTTALADRKQVEIELANLQIDTLSDQLDDLKAQLAKAPAGSTEAQTLSALVTDLTDRLASMRSDVAALPAETYTNRSDSPLYTRISSNFSQGMGAVEDSMSALLTDGRNAMSAAALMVMAIAAQTAATSDPSDPASLAELAGRNSEVEDTFEDIADQLDAAAQRLQKMLQRFDKANDATMDRIESVARALLAAISDILSALDGLEDSAGGPPPVGQTVGNRLRLGI